MLGYKEVILKKDLDADSVRQLEVLRDILSRPNNSIAPSDADRMAVQVLHIAKAHKVVVRVPIRNIPTLNANLKVVRKKIRAKKPVLVEDGEATTTLQLNHLNKRMADYVCRLKNYITSHLIEKVKSSALVVQV